MIYKMDLKDSSDTMTFNLLETPIVDKDIEGAVDNVTLDGNQYTDYLYLKKQYIQKWAIMCPDEYDELRGFYTRQFEEGEVPSYRFYYGANVTRDYTFNGDYFQFNAEGIETGMTLSQLTGNAEQTTYSGKNLFSGNFSQFDNQGGTGSTYAYFKLPTDGVYTLSLKAKNTITASNHYLGFSAEGGSATNYKWTYQNSNATAGQVFVTTNVTGGGSILGFVFMYPTDSTTLQWFVDNFEIQLEAGSTDTAYEPYVGGIPAPNPNYPQAVNTVTGEQAAKIEGKNLFDIGTSFDSWFATDINGTRVINGDIRTKITGSISNGKIKIDTYDNSGGFWWMSKLVSLPKNATLTAMTADGTHMMLRVLGFTSLATSATGDVLLDWQTSNHTAQTFNSGDYPYYVVSIYPSSASNNNSGVVDRLQLELGSAATAYEPYQGQSYEVDLSLASKNMLNPSWMTAGFISVNGGITPNQSQGESACQYFIPVEPNTQYTFEIFATSDAYPAWIGIGQYSTASESGFTTRLADTSGSYFTFTTASNTHFIRPSARNLQHATEYMLSKGSRTTYEPYFELAKVGNYQDRIYKNDGKWYIEKQIEKATFYGSSDESWTLGTTGSLRYPFGIDIVGKGWTSSSIDGVMCDKFTLSTSSETGIAEQNQFTFRGTSYNNRLWFFCPKSAITGSTSAEILASYKTFLSTHPTTVYYALATPTTTEITDETLLLQLNFLASLYEGENNISLVGTGAQGEMEVFIRDVMSRETDVVPEVPVRLTLTDDGVINACGCRRNVQLTMRETTE